uniref:UDP-N-acetylglucosamine--dolichyl-phosphate N-acetylglucosaminephosphotransferase n=1 Tax=Mesocestoides corti TaxID=53468 RepID=A0A5K3EL83_MESCO
MSFSRFPFDQYALELCVIGSMTIASFFLTKSLIKSFGGIFIKAGLHGVDMNKANKPILPEAQGVIAAAVYLNCMFLFIPLPFRKHILNSIHWYNRVSHFYVSSQTPLSNDDILAEQAVLFKTRLIPFLAALLSICCMIFLGFADDVLNLRWRHKLVLPSISSLPLLMVHVANLETTHIAVPLLLQPFFGISVDIGFLYFVYMGMLAVFCTNAINIYAGVNGLESGQSLVIAVSVIIFNTLELNGPEWKAHLFSLYFLLPFIGVTFALLQRNWFSPVTGLLHPSTVSFRVTSLSRLGRFCLDVFLWLRLTHLSHPPPCSVDIDAMEEESTSEEVTVDNFTLINLFLRVFGPTTETRTTAYLLVIQILCSCLAFVIRYPIAWVLYGHPN